MSNDPHSPDGGPASPPVGGGTEVIGDGSRDGWTPAEAVLRVNMPTGAARYVVERELARGSMGVVRAARDLALQRQVALKALAPESEVPDAAARFFEEARITAQLQHPSIVAVYEISVAEDETPFFTMQLIEGQTLEDILNGLRRNDAATLRRYGRLRLLNLFMQVCMAVAYAHNRGVIHRDLKPANVMLGEFGEVFVMDWGLAKIVDSQVDRPLVGGRGEARFETRVGEITGTPSYMSPEQAMGLVDVLTPATDIYALGAILYELLTLSPPHQAADTPALLRAVRKGVIEPPSSRAPEADISPDLEAVALRCLAREPQVRYRTAIELRDEVEACLTGGHTQMRRVRGNTRLLRDAQRSGQLFRDLARRRRRRLREVAEARALRLPVDGPEQVARLAKAARQADGMCAEVEQAFGQAVAQFHQLINDLPDLREAHDGLRELYWYRFLEAERRADGAEMALFAALAAQHDPGNTLRRPLLGAGTLRITTTPPGVKVRLHRYAAAADEPGLSSAPVGDIVAAHFTYEELPLGSYRLTLRHGEVRGTAALTVGRQERVDLHLHLGAAEGVPPGCVWVPAGPWWSGTGDGGIPGALPRTRQNLTDYCVSRLPVTVAEYTAFLAAQEHRGEALRHAGLVPVDGGWRPAADGRWFADQPAANPVVGVSAAAAEAYCAWRGLQDGRAWRLPSEGEWEKAARGADGRAYPWGDLWEPTWCQCAEGPEGGGVSAVGHEEHDRSPYGVAALSGGVRELTATLHPHDARYRMVKGGGFASPASACHLAARSWHRGDRPATDLGFRLALSLETPLALTEDVDDDATHV